MIAAPAASGLRPRARATAPGRRAAEKRDPLPVIRGHGAMLRPNFRGFTDARRCPVPLTSVGPCVPRSSRSSSCSRWLRLPAPPRSPISTVARSGCRRSTGTQKVRLAAPGGQRHRRDREVARGGGLRQRPDRRRAQRARHDLALLVVQGLGAQRHVHGRGAAQRPSAGPLRLPARLRRHRGRPPHGLRLLEQRLVLPDHASRRAPTSGR